MRDALRITWYQLMQPAKSRDIMIGAAVIVMMTLVMGVLEFTRRAWVEPAMNIFGIVALAQFAVSIVRLERRIRRLKRDEPTGKRKVVGKSGIFGE